jgi:hypothetical protein
MQRVALRGWDMSARFRTLRIAVLVLLLGAVVVGPLRWYVICERFEAAETKAQEEAACRLANTWVLPWETYRVDFFDKEGMSLGRAIDFLRFPGAEKWEEVAYVEIVVPLGFSAKRKLIWVGNLDYLIGA